MCVDRQLLVSSLIGTYDAKVLQSVNLFTAVFVELFITSSSQLFHERSYLICRSALRKISSGGVNI